MCNVFLKCVRADQDVVDVYNNIVLQHVTEDVIYESLEHGGGFTEAKGHDQVLMVSCGS